jgi:hypothetical protein
MHEALVKAHSVLTPEQRDKVANRIEKRGPKAALKGGKKGQRDKGKRDKDKRKKEKRKKGKRDQKGSSKR